jgi:hypothetical protein
VIRYRHNSNMDTLIRLLLPEFVEVIRTSENCVTKNFRIYTVHVVCLIQEKRPNEAGICNMNGTNRK